MATFHEAKHSVVYMHLDDVKGQMVTCGIDRVIKVSTSTQTGSHFINKNIKSFKHMSCDLFDCG